MTDLPTPKTFAEHRAVIGHGLIFFGKLLAVMVCLVAIVVVVGLGVSQVYNWVQHHEIIKTIFAWFLRITMWSAFALFFGSWMYDEGLKQWRRRRQKVS
jgi:hypothetical protein